MKNALKITLLIIILFLFILPTGLFADNENRLLNRQDGRLLKKLEWYSPNGELPGSYEDYIKKHPLKTALFFQSKDYYPNIISKGKSISILVNQLLYLNIKSDLNEYILDLQAEGYIVHLQKVIGGSPIDIKDKLLRWIKRLEEENPEFKKERENENIDLTRDIAIPIFVKIVSNLDNLEKIWSWIRPMLKGIKPPV